MSSKPKNFIFKKLKGYVERSASYKGKSRLALWND
jgi:hypothetical protein